MIIPALYVLSSVFGVVAFSFFVTFAWASASAFQNVPITFFQSSSLKRCLFFLDANLNGLVGCEVVDFNSANFHSLVSLAGAGDVTGAKAQTFSVDNIFSVAFGAKIAGMVVAGASVVLFAHYSPLVCMD